MDPVGITNLALLKIGAQAQVSSINPSDGSTEGDAASVLYQPTMDGLFSAAHWNFTRRQVAGTLIAASYYTPENSNQTLPQPLQPWLYSYAFPSDCIKVRYILPSFGDSTSSVPISTGFTPISGTVGGSAGPIVGSVPYITGIDLDSSGNQIRIILTNMPSAQIVYTARITNCDLWDSNFIEAAAASLGAWLVNAIARNAQLSVEMQKIAMTIINSARVSDGNEGITVVDHQPDWIAIRGIGSYAGLGGYYSTYDAMSWPGGVAA